MVFLNNRRQKHQYDNLQLRAVGEALKACSTRNLPQAIAGSLPWSGFRPCAHPHKSPFKTQDAVEHVRTGTELSSGFFCNNPACD